MRYKDGVIATVSASVNVKKPFEAYVYGTKGHIRVPDFFGATELFVSVNDRERHIKKVGAYRFGRFLCEK